MAEPFDTLLQVQHHDTTIDQLRHRKASFPERAELATVEAERATLAARADELRGQVEDLSGRQSVLEEQIAASARRRHEIEQRMLSGGVSDSRDLQAMDAEVHNLSERQALLEEQELALLEEEEPLDVALAANDTKMAMLAIEAELLLRVIAETERDIEDEVTREQAERAAVAAGLPSDLADRYEQLRSRLGGVGAARLVGDHCEGCHLTLPSMEVERIRHLPPDEFATCDQCGRILVH